MQKRNSVTTEACLSYLELHNKSSW